MHTTSRAGGADLTRSGRVLRVLLVGSAAVVVTVATLVLTLTAIGSSGQAATPATVDATVSTSVSAAARTPVLGSPRHEAPIGRGWGTVAPGEVFNGGDPAGDASHLTWTGWGSSKAIAHGVLPIFRPGGGYYRRPGALLLRADHLGTCADGTYAYTRLLARVAHRPGGPVSRHWRPWGPGPICRPGA